MSANPQLSPPPVHKFTTQYVDHKIVEMEERLAKGQANRFAQTEARLSRGHFESMREIGALKREVKNLFEAMREIGALKTEIKNLKEASAFPNTSSDPPLSRENCYSPQAPHSAREIRDLIHQNGHKIVVSEPFNCRQYATALEKIAKLRSGDRVVIRGRTVFHKRVQTTMSDWVRSDKTGQHFYSNCPFEKVAFYEYAVKEGWRWHNQTA